MGSGFSKMKKQARQFKAQMNEVQEKLKQKVVEGSSGNGLVSVALSGEKRLLSVRIKPECVDPQDVEGLQDLIIAAFEDAYLKLNDTDSSPFNEMMLPLA